LLGSGKTATDDDGQLLVSSEPPFVKMPRRPANWLDGEISLRMEKLEADFLREHVARVRPKDRAEPSLIARLARLEMVPPSDMFDDAVLAVDRKSTRLNSS